MKENRVRDKANHKLVLELLELESGLTKYEVDFAESIVQQLESGITLSFKQQEKLRQIYEQRIEEAPDTTEDD